jgi:CO/xanthine dehydrogenase Mo-binding subunit
MGQGVQTSLGQIVAQVLGIRPRDVRVTTPDTDLTPYDTSTSSSRTIFSMGTAAKEAAMQIRGQLQEIAAEALEAPVGDIEIVDGAAYVRGVPDRSVRIPELFRKRFGLPVGSLFGACDFQSTGGLDHNGKGRATTFFFLAAAAAEVEVNTRTGKVRVVRLVTSTDVGKAISPRLCHSQNEGSMIMGLGTALFEEMYFDNGQPVNSSFLDYPIPSMEDHPDEFRSILIETAHPDGPFGAKGMGEAAIPAVAPAIGNAVARALGGVRIRDLPLAPERILDAITEAYG